MDRQIIFDRQLEKCGVEYFDNYLLHNINSGDIDAVEKYDCFGFARSLKAQGKIKRYGFSFHDTPELLNKVLTEHPDAEFVQLQINYLDWKSEGVQSERLWQVARKHGKASDCIKCGACERHCPQHLPIRDLLVKVAEKFE